MHTAKGENVNNPTQVTDWKKIMSTLRMKLGTNMTISME